MAGWAASPARFREDANAEEDLVTGGYRDRLLVELAQNAADAAARAGVSGILRLSLVTGGRDGGGAGEGDGRGGAAHGELRAANTGAPLDADGVQALATLRASAKRSGETVGRFGVGFAAVVSVSDEPLVVSGPGGVRFSAAASRAAVQALPALGDELRRRGGQVPVLRLPWPAGPVEPPPAGFATEVRLPLRSGAAAGVRAALDDLAAPLLLTLPGLARIEVDGRMLSREDRPGGDVLVRDGAGETRWRVLSRSGVLPAALLAGRPVEERERARWSVTWAVPVDGADVPVPLADKQVVHAPTPSDEPLSAPARLVGTFPLGPDRRHVAPGPITDLLVGEAGGAYAELIAGLPAVPATLGLVPRPGLAAAPLDAALVAAALDALARTTWLPTAPTDPADGTTVAMASPADGTAAVAVASPATAAAVGMASPADGTSTDATATATDGTGTAAAVASPATATAVAVAVAVAVASPATAAAVGMASPAGYEPPGRVAPREATVVDAASDGLVAALADVIPGLLPAAWSGRSATAVLTALGVRRLSTADVVDRVSGVERPAAWWRRLYAGLADAPDREALAGLPVPLVDGRTVTGVRGSLLPEPTLPAAAVAALGLRVVHPDAAHPLLERLGAVPATPAGVLADPRLAAAVSLSFDTDDPAPVADAVLALVAAAGLAPGELPELAELALPGADGDWYPAGELLLPGSALAAVVRPDAPFGVAAAELVQRWGTGTLRAVGVLDTFSMLAEAEVDVDPDAPALDLDGEQEWYDAVLDRLPPDQPVPPRLRDVLAVRDLEEVRLDGWRRALPLVAALPGVLAPVSAELADGTRLPVPSYTSWWLSTHEVLAGERPDRLRLPSAVDLAGLYDVVRADPAGGATASDSALLAAIGVLAGIDDALADPERASGLLRRLADPARTLPAPTLRTVYRRLAAALDGVDVDAPAGVRVGPRRVVSPDAAVVLDAPYLLPLLDGRAVVPVGGAPGPVADLLGLPFGTEVVAGATVDRPPARRLRWADLPGVELAAERIGAAVPDAVLLVHDELTVGGRPVPWWVSDEGDHVDAEAGPETFGRALAWRLDRWERRAAAAEAFGAPAEQEWLRAEDTLE